MYYSNHYHHLTIKNPLCPGRSFKKLSSILENSIFVDRSRSKILPSYSMILHSTCRMEKRSYNMSILKLVAFVVRNHWCNVSPTHLRWEEDFVLLSSLFLHLATALRFLLLKRKNKSSYFLFHGYNYVDINVHTN